MAGPRDMIEAILSIFGMSGFSAAVAGVVAAVLAFGGLLLKARRDGAKDARQAIEAEASSNQLEMHRDAVEIERQVGQLSDDQITARLKARAKR